MRWRTRPTIRTETLDFLRSRKLQWSISTGTELSMGTPGMNHPPRGRLNPDEETFLQAVLWEEGHLVRGPAVRMAEEQGVSLLRLLEPANRLSPNLHGEALSRLMKGPCPRVKWPWPRRGGD